MTKSQTLSEYNNAQNPDARAVCEQLAEIISLSLKKSESKIWHGSPVWFLDGNPIVSYSVRVSGKVALMFFSGQSFATTGLAATGSFKAAEILYSTTADISIPQLKKWLRESIAIQWDYKSIVKKKGVLERIEI